MKKLIGALSVAGLVLAAPVASAALITQWDYTVTLNWTGATFVDGVGAGVPFGEGTQTVNDDLISWGAPNGDHTNQNALPRDSRSALEIEDDVATGVVITNGGIAPTNTVIHWNNAISNSYDTLNTATARTTLTLTPLVPPGTPEDTVSRTFTVQFAETPNVEPCGFDSQSVCDDIFTIVLGDLDFQFQRDNVIYTVSIVELSGNLGPLDAATCAAAGAPAGCVGIVTIENDNTAVNFGILITAQVLPEPGVLALLGVGLLGLGAARRRKAA